MELEKARAELLRWATYDETAVIQNLKKIPSKGMYAVELEFRGLRGGFVISAEDVRASKVPLLERYEKAQAQLREKFHAGPNGK